MKASLLFLLACTAVLAVGASKGRGLRRRRRARVLGGTHGGRSRGAPCPPSDQARACRGRRARGAEGAGAEGAGAGPESHGHGQGRHQQGAGIGGGAAGQVPPNPASPVPVLVPVPVPRCRRGARPEPHADPLPSSPRADSGCRTTRSWPSSGWCGSRKSWRSSGRRLRPHNLAEAARELLGPGTPSASPCCRGALNKVGLTQTLWWHHWGETGRSVTRREREGWDRHQH